MPPDSLRVAAEERRNAHRMFPGDPEGSLCEECDNWWPCADRRFAELVITTLNEASRNTYFEYPHSRGECRLVPDQLGEHAD